MRNNSTKLIFPALLLALTGCFDISPNGEALTVAENPPPPILGGGLLVAQDGFTVLATDPDHDTLWAADLSDFSGSPEPIGVVQFNEGDMPHRLIEGEAGTFYVVLRTPGAVATIQRSGNSFTEVSRTEVCANPRGIDYDAGELFVSCTGGELVNLDSEGVVLKRHKLQPDLRDVVVKDDKIFVAVFRKAAVIELDRAGESVKTHELKPSAQDIDLQNGDNFFPGEVGGNRFAGLVPSVAWRMIETTEGVAVVHQLSQADVGSGASTSVATQSSGGYGGSPGTCNGAIVEAAVTYIGGPEQHIVSLGNAVLPVDMTLLADRILVASAGTTNRGISDSTDSSGGFGFEEGISDGAPFNPGFPGDETFGSTTSALRVAPHPTEELPPIVTKCGKGEQSAEATDGRQVTAVASLADGRWVSFSRDPWMIFTDSQQIPLAAGDSRKDSGHDVFHEDAGQGIACASCHPEGSDDAQVWTFEGIGDRRTQDLRGGILGTEPFHWDGDMADIDHLSSEVFTHRMGGATLTTAWTNRLASWIDTMPHPKRANVDMEAARRGEELFHDEVIGCNDCHSGEKLTNAQTVDVGTGGAFQVPSLLGIQFRAPFMHDGCADTLEARFDESCGGQEHGDVSQMTEAQVDDMVVYLKTL